MIISINASLEENVEKSITTLQNFFLLNSCNCVKLLTS
jgi:hypothetical protein